MRLKSLTLFVLFVVLSSCKTDTTTDTTFDKALWSVKQDKDYPHRPAMFNDVLYNDTIRTLNKTEIIGLLGKPDRSNEGYIYYMIEQKRLGFWPLHSKFLVVKFKDNDSIDWIKIHE